MSFKELCKDSKYTYSVNVATDWVYRKKNGESDKQLKMYSNIKTFMTHDEIKLMYK